MSQDNIFLIDANSFCYRAFYAIRNLTTSTGMPTGAIYGFATFIMRLLAEEHPGYVAFCFDSGRKTFRSERFADYKAHRPKMPDDLSVQMSKIKDLIKAFNLKSFELEGFEADDIIATLAKKFEKLGKSIFIVTSDKDMFQLIDKNLKIYNPMKKPPEIIDENGVKEKFGVKPSQISDYLALTGDASDNIPGAMGIGEKSAAKLIGEFGSVEKLLKGLEGVESDSIREKIEVSRDSIIMSKELTQLKLDVPIKISLEDIEVAQPDETKLFEIYKELEFKSLLKNLAPKPTRSTSAKLRKEVKSLEAVLEAAQKEKELLLYLDPESKTLYLACSDLYYKANAISKELKAVLVDSRIKKISDDIKAIRVMLLEKGIELEGSYLDLRLAFYLIDSGRSDYSLAAIAFDYLSKIVPQENPAIDEFFSIMDELRFVEKELSDRDMDKLFFEIEMPLLEVLADLEICGIKIDRELLEDFSSSFSVKLKKLTKEIFKLADKEFNINSPKQLSQVLFEDLGLPVKKRRKSHASTDEEVLRSLAKDYPIADLIIQVRKLTKLKTTYLDALPMLIAKDGKIHTSFNQTVTQTGRLSSSNPNMQNIPIKTEDGAQIRKAFVAGSKSGLLLSADYSQIELRILAHLSKEPALAEAFRDNIDVHEHTAKLIFSLKDSDTVEEQMRYFAKRINFGIIYGMSPFGLAKDLGISLEEANEFIENYFLRYPRVREFMNSCIIETRENGFIATLMGRRRYLPAINSKNNQLRSFAERQAINMPVQGSAADLIKKAMLDIYKEFKSKEFSSKMVLQVHDELVFDCAKEEVDEIIPIVKAKMENAFTLSVPIKVSIKKGKNWLEMEEVA